MARARSPNRDKAFKLYKESNGTKPLVEIAAKLGVSDSQIRKWKHQDKWEQKLNSNVTITKSNVTNKAGAPKGNKNAIGNRGGSAPPKNKNAEKHGLFTKYLPEETLELVEHFEQENEITKLKRNIAIQEAAIIRSQKIMHVESKDELIKHLKKSASNNFGETEEWEFQYAWDRQGNFLTSLSRAMSTLMSMYKQLNELTKDNNPEDDVKDKINTFVEALNESAEDVWDDEQEEE